MSEHSSSISRPASPVGPLPDLHPARPYRFNWDPSSRRPAGPGSVSETTEGRGGDYFASQTPAFGAFNTSSTNLAQGALPEDWSSSKHGFHAISTVLNNPHKSQAPPKAHSALPSVPPADLPRVRRKDFDSYLRAVAPEWERFERNNRLGTEGAALVGPSTPKASLTLEEPMSPTTPRTPRPSGRTIPSLESVPAIFFERTFNIGDPRTFNAVTEQREGEEDTSDPSALSHSLPLLEKMSHYADTVEQHLVREISLRSTSFFAALTNLQDLQTESEQCLDRISQLRGLLKDVDEKGAKRGLEVVRKEGKLRNLDAVRDGVKMVNGVVEMTGVAKGLVSAGQWGEALGVIEEMEALWSSESTPEPKQSHTRAKSKSLPSLPVDGQLSPIPPSPDEPRPPNGHDRPLPLSSLQAFASLPSHLRTLTMEIATSLSSEVVGALRADLVERIIWDPSSAKSHEDLDQTLKDRLKPLFQGLIRTNSVREAVLSWREVVLGEVRVAIKRHIPFDLDADNPQDKAQAEHSAGLANHLRNMSHSEFIVILRAMYRSLLNGIHGLQAQNSVIIELLEPLQSSSSSLDIPSLREELSDILSAAAEFSNTRAAKVVGFRSEQHAALDLPDFLGFFNESWNFVLQCEVICRRMIVSLRGAVVSQAKVFLQTFHQARISSSAKLVEDEQWNPAEVSQSLQRTANILVNSAVHDSPELVVKLNAVAPAPPSPGLNGREPPPSALFSPSTPNLQSNGSSSTSKHLRIEDRTYFTVSATSEVLILLLDYLKVIVNLSMLTTDTMSRIIEFLKAFNSRTCQVVLGAGAMRSAGLKNITAKHLALASQSLSIMIALIPYVRETFRRHLSQKQAVMLVEFDKLKRDYQEHQNEIHSKLIAIMGDRLSAHIKSLQTVNWDSPPSGSGPNGYMELLVKETVTLHKVLSRYLSTPVVEYVMTQVFAAINHRLSEEYAGVELPSQEAKDRLLADAKYLHQKLSALKNVGAPSTMLETVIAEKRIAGQPGKPAPASAPAPGTSANQRIKGMLSRKASTLSEKPPVEKALPSPIPAAPSFTSFNSSPGATPPASNGDVTLGQQNGNGNGHADPPPPTSPRPQAGATPGFKQVEVPATAAVEGDAANGLSTPRQPSNSRPSTPRPAPSGEEATSGQEPQPEPAPAQGS
ncbi:hypothetical protein PLICRDRAFT_40765 [Plicaturopsis crispa FD-325 SS-3]|nr:hypothetical protein PLICRDRAFT_40765 [Plicaturopsis crispa FD-325 SS-3]